MNSDNPSSTIETNSFWKTQFDHYKLSQLSKAEYARKHNLVRHQFVYQLRKFEAPTKKTPAIKFDFIPITIKPEILMSDKTRPILCTLQLGDNKKLLLHMQGKQFIKYSSLARHKSTIFKLLFLNFLLAKF